jgi:hypothetical protein
VPFLTRPPSGSELEQLRLVLSSFRDGGGQIQDNAGTLPGWRDYERAIATVFRGWAPENKGVFDVFVGSSVNDTTDYGYSVKSKELSRAGAIEDLSTDGRVYMELSNSPAKLWAAVRAAGPTEEDFRAGRHADIIGGALLAAVTSWHHEAAAAHLAATGRTLDLDRSAFLVISYSRRRPGRERDYQIHSFDLGFPPGIAWRYRSAKSLIGEDPAHPGECLFDWYPFSGGQLKYYPRASAARYASPRFQLSIPPATSLADRAAGYFPDDWRGAGGAASATAASVATQLEGLAKLCDDDRVRAVLLTTADTLRALN